MPVGHRQLQQFVAVAEELSFRKAARRLHMSQPPLTQAIRRLEHNIGVRLFERGRNGVSLTAGGQVFLEDAKRMLERMQGMIGAARRAADGTRGRLRISFVPSAALGLVPLIVTEFRRRYPEVALELHGDTTTAQLDSLRAGRTDVGIVVPPLRDATDIRVTPLCRERLVAAVPSAHRLGAGRSIRLEQLADEPFVLFPLSQGPAFLSAILLACRRAGFFPKVVQESPQMQMIVTLVACGIGVSLVPAAIAVVQRANVSYLDIRGRFKPQYELAAASLKQADNPALARFLSVGQEVARWPQILDPLTRRAVSGLRERGGGFSGAAERAGRRR